MSPKKNLHPFVKSCLQWAARLLLLWLCIEIPACLSGRLLDEQALVYRERDMSRFAAYAERRDPVLGWVRARPGTADGNSLDESGARKLPAYPDPAQPPCISAYGDSFVFGSEVFDEHTWANLLARRLRCRIADYGVPGYGTDQAYLRYLGRKDDAAKVVLLGIFTEDLQRNVTRYQALLSPKATFGLKPRFLLDEQNELVLLPVPFPDEAGMRAISDDAGEHLPHEHFRIGGHESLTRWQFPYALSLLRLVTSPRTIRRLAQQPFHEPFFDPSHPSGALPLTLAIASAFQKEAARRGAFAGVIVFPAWNDMHRHKETGTWIYKSLIDGLARSNAPVLDVGARLAELPDTDDYCGMYVRCKAGHFTEVANHKVADFIFDWLRALGKL